MFFAKWRKKRADARFRRGYEFAAGFLLELRHHALPMLRQGVEESIAFGEYDAFDRGVQSAMRDYRGLINGTPKC